MIVTWYMPPPGPLRAYDIDVPNPSITRGTTLVEIVMLNVWPRAAPRSDADFGWTDHCTVLAPLTGSLLAKTA
ncbi:MAG TPA: hypothetical protein VMU72_08845 [Gaiellaceae bacterium]|nr:hypothetical protein [Gaiellaceae bacterium]